MPFVLVLVKNCLVLCGVDKDPFGGGGGAVVRCEGTGFCHYPIYNSPYLRSGMNICRFVMIVMLQVL